MNSKKNEEVEMLSGDHGVYCLATATSFTSNVSSVSNSQCAELDAYLNFNGSPTFKTHLSLFDFTPTSQRMNPGETCLRLGINDNLDYTEIKNVFNHECII